MLSAILIGWVVGPDWVIEEVEFGGRKFPLRKLYAVMIRYIVPVIMFVLFLQSTGILSL
jgi:NSS family neurotransmitter:Na+ symporter